MPANDGENYCQYVERLSARVDELEKQLNVTPSAEMRAAICSELDTLLCELKSLGERNDGPRKR